MSIQAEAQSKPLIGHTPAPTIQRAVDTAKDSNLPLTGSPKQMLDNLPNRHPIPLTSLGK